MNNLDKQQAFSALVSMTMALFVLSGFVREAQWRRRLRLGAIAIFAVAAVFAIVQVVIWLAPL